MSYLMQLNKKKKKKERNLIQVGKKKYKVDAAEIKKKYETTIILANRRR